MPPEEPLVPLNPNSTPDEVIENSAPPVDVPDAAAPPAEEPKSNLEALSETLAAIAPPKDAAADPNAPPAAPVDPNAAQPGIPPGTDAAAKPEEESPEAYQARIEKLYTIPSGLKGEHRKLYKELVDHAQEVERTLSTQREEVSGLKAWNDDYRAVVEDCKAVPEQIAMAFEFLHAMNHGNFEDALKLIEEQRTNIARMAGKALPGVDLLEGFDDLREAVENLEITEDRAHEIARYRRQEQVGQQRAEHERQTTEQRQQQEREQQAFAQAKGEAIADIDKWLGDLAGKDIDFPAKNAALTQYLARPETKELLQTLPPKQWRTHLQAIYDALRSAQPAPAPVATRTPQPLRPRGGGSGARSSAPSSAQDALDRALGYRAAG